MLIRVLSEGVRRTRHTCVRKVGRATRPRNLQRGIAVRRLRLAAFLLSLVTVSRSTPAPPHPASTKPDLNAIAPQRRASQILPNHPPLMLMASALLLGTPSNRTR